MIVVKNTFGISASISPRIAGPELLNTLGGSSLNRKKTAPKEKINDPMAELLKQPLGQTEKKKEKKLRSMSSRTKGKIRKKLIAFARIHKNLSFLTLTFVNEVQDSTAVKVLRVFLDNAKKRSKDFQYLWVAERQTKNTVFENNIHFHLITNKYWKLEKWWPYWLDVQARFGILPREAGSKPSSAFDVRHVSSNNIKGIVNYLTKYVTKNQGQFDCQVWNCSKKISRLYTEFYSGLSFLRHLEALEKSGQLGGELKIYPQEFCNIHIVPLNRRTMNLYNRIDEKNKAVWQEQD
ncbi:hypothetical protein SAMN05444410_108166 [Hydrobacter penzbergensis]|uniref:Replication-associated protein ORF2/G2P domain-containing protein n=2 Tax=Hydrobacter penzbergensis TaxID=1235997 RepID=A0A8X8LE10_9BACT|nr:hypothetical protein SAMN05444410_108166 [Hydrobacter penzbergensis]